MDPVSFGAFRDSIYDGIAELNKKKGADYAGDEDALANFKEAAADIGVSPYVIWYVYFHKHLSAVKRFVEKGQVESEPIEGRIDDAILYLFLLRGLIKDEQMKPAEERLGDRPE